MCLKKKIGTVLFFSVSTEKGLKKNNCAVCFFMSTVSTATAVTKIFEKKFSFMLFSDVNGVNGKRVEKKN